MLEWAGRGRGGRSPAGRAGRRRAGSGRAPHTLPPASGTRAGHPDRSGCSQGQARASRFGRQRRSASPALPPPDPAGASKPRKSNQIGRSNLQRFAPGAAGRERALIFLPF